MLLSCAKRKYVSPWFIDKLFSNLDCNVKMNLFQWSEFMEIGKEVPEEELIDRIRGQAPNKCCTLIYTVSRISLVFSIQKKQYVLSEPTCAHVAIQYC